MKQSPKDSKLLSVNFSPKVGSRLLTRRGTSALHSDCVANTNKSLYDEYSSSFDLSHTPFAQTPTHRQIIDLAYQKEFKGIEEELDAQEISLKNYNFINKSTNKIITNEFVAYYRYLESIAYLLKKKDQKLGSAIIRGIFGLEKAYKNLTEIKNEAKEIKFVKKARVKELGIQTEAKIQSETTDTLTDEELDSLKKLGIHLSKIKFSKVSLRLIEAYESLVKMNTSLPDLSDMPENLDYTGHRIMKDLESNFKHFQSEIKSKLFSLKKIDNSVEKEVQTDDIVKPKSLFDDKHRSFQVKIEELRLKSEKLEKEKTKAEEEGLKNYSIAQDIAKRYDGLEKENQKLTIKRSGYEDAIKLLREKITQLSDKVTKKRRRKFMYKKNIEDLKVKITGKRSKMSQLLENNYELKIH